MIWDEGDVASHSQEAVTKQFDSTSQPFRKEGEFAKKPFHLVRNDHDFGLLRFTTPTPSILPYILSFTVSNKDTILSYSRVLVFISSFCLINVIVHRHEDDPSFELLWFTLWFSHHPFESRREFPMWSILGHFFHSNSIGSPSIRSKSLR